MTFWATWTLWAARQDASSPESGWDWIARDGTGLGVVALSFFLGLFVGLQIRNRGPRLTAAKPREQESHGKNRVQAAALLTEALTLLGGEAAVANDAPLRVDFGKAEAARRKIKLAQTKDPDNPLIHVRFGQYFRAMGQWDLALERFDKALAKDPKDTAARLNRGVACQCQGDWDAAILEFDRVIALDPVDIPAYRLRGKTWRQKGDMERALHDLNRAIALAPKNAEAFYERGLCHRAQGKPDAAKADFESARRLAPKGPLSDQASAALAEVSAEPETTA